MYMRNEYAFLSNYYPCDVEYEGLKFKNSEAAFQAQKEISLKKRAEYCDLPPNEAKRKGRQAILRPYWDEIKDQIMYEVVLAKFTQNEDFKEALMAVTEEIVEDNHWNDTYWGRCNGVGQNKLGKILMKIRKQFWEEAKNG